MSFHISRACNAKNELLAHVADVNSPLVAATVKIERFVLSANPERAKDYLRDKLIFGPFTLFGHHTVEEYEQFLKNITIDYDSGWGTQELYGTLWFADGSWSDREEYDGSEGWEHRKLPALPVRPNSE